MINVLLRRKPYRGWWVMLVTAFAGMSVSATATFAFTVLIKPMTEDLGWSHAQLLGAFTVSGFLGALISPFLGRAVDRYGGRVVLTSSLLYLGLMLVLTAEVNALWQFYLLYSVSVALALAGVIRVSATAIGANWFIRRRAVAFAVLFSALPLSGVIFTPVFQAMVDQWDWRMVWRIAGLAIIAVPVPLAWLVIRRRPEDVGLRPDGDSVQISAQRGDGLEVRPVHMARATEESWTLREASRTRTFWLINLSLFLIGFPSTSIILVMHPYFTDLDVSATTAAQLVSFYAFMAFLGSLVGGTLIQLTSVRVLLAPFAAFYGSSVVLFVIVGGSSVFLMYLVLVPLGISIMGNTHLASQVWADYYGRRNIGSLVGMANLVRTAPLAVGPLIAAAIRDSNGDYGLAFLIFAGLCFVAAVALFFAKPPRKKPSHNERGTGIQ